MRAQPEAPSQPNSDRLTLSSSQVKEQGSGFVFAVGGLLVGLVAVWRTFGSLQHMAGAVLDCTEHLGMPLGQLRTELIVGAIGGLAAAVLSEVGSRRRLEKGQLLSVAGSVIGVFALMANFGMLIATVPTGLQSCLGA